jgi:polyhydroxyalkanoate synthesis regulator phasin
MQTELTMVKKTTTPPADDEQFASAARTSAQQIWEAGLGAFAKAQEEGSRVFSRLVSEGHELQRRRADEKAAGEADPVFEERVRSVVAAMDLPMRHEVEALQRRIDELRAAVAALAVSPAPKKPAAAKPATAKPAIAKPATAPATAKSATVKPAARTTAARKTAAKKTAV